MSSRTELERVLRRVRPILARDPTLHGVALAELVADWLVDYCDSEPESRKSAMRAFSKAVRTVYRIRTNGAAKP